MLKRIQFLILIAALALGASACVKAALYRSGKPILGSVALGPFPKQPAGIAGYNLYFSETKDGKFEKINDSPVGGGSRIRVPLLNPGQEYYFKMTSVSLRDPAKESVPSAAFKRVATAYKD